MTSKPPSRSARAIILAPRSWPSRPGLATRIRNLLSAIFSATLRHLRPTLSKPTRIRVDAEFSAKYVANLAYCNFTAYCLADRFHQVLVRAARLGDPFERVFDRGAVALALHLAHALNLPLFERRIDLQQLNRNLLGNRELVHPDNRLDTLFELPLVIKCCLCNFALRI